MYLADEDVNKTSTQRRGTHYMSSIPKDGVGEGGGELTILMS